MSFPSAVTAVLDQYGVDPETKAVLYDLYVSLGSEVLEVFADLADRNPVVSDISAEELGTMRQQVVERFLRRNHPRWLENTPTPSLWHPRALEGRASGLAVPLGVFGDGISRFAEDVWDLARSIVGERQPLPAGVLMMGKNAHYGGRAETISFDVVAEDLDDALAIAQSAGQQHTLPGSVGETSGTIDEREKLFLLWEIQPNVLKPSAERNSEISKVYRRHRNWHVVTLVMALKWLVTRGYQVFILRGSVLSATHEVNKEKPVVPVIVELHDRTVRQVIEGLGLTLGNATDEDHGKLLETELANTALTKYLEDHHLREAAWKVEQNTGAPFSVSDTSP